MEVVAPFPGSFSKISFSKKVAVPVMRYPMNLGNQEPLNRDSTEMPANLLS